MENWKHSKGNVILPLVEVYQPVVTKGFIGALHHSLQPSTSLFVILSELVRILNTGTPAFSCILYHRLNRVEQRNTSAWCLLLHKYLQIFKLIPSIYVTCL